MKIPEAHLKALTVALLFLFGLAIYLPPTVAQIAKSPLSIEDVTELLRGKVAPERVGKLATDRGIDFELTHENEVQLRNAGATDALVDTLRERAPKSKVAGSAESASKLIFTTPNDKTSYALGMNIGTGLHKQGVSVNSEMMMQGLKDAMSGSKTLLTEDEMKELITQLQNDVRRQLREVDQQVGATNRKEGDAFLTVNKAKAGVVTLPSGLQYKILKEGTGPKPALSDTVSCNYRGTLIDGKEFDSSYKRGQPASFPVSGVIKGWTVALQMMAVGSKWQLFIPADLAYGDRGAGGVIRPGDTLIFEIELLSIERK